MALWGCHPLICGGLGVEQCGAASLSGGTWVGWWLLGLGSELDHPLAVVGLFALWSLSPGPGVHPCNGGTTLSCTPPLGLRGRLLAPGLVVPWDIAIVDPGLSRPGAPLPGCSGETWMQTEASQEAGSSGVGTPPMYPSPSPPVVFGHT